MNVCNDSVLAISITSKLSIMKLSFNEYVSRILEYKISRNILVLKLFSDDAISSVSNTLYTLIL